MDRSETVVQKYGGSSLAADEDVRTVARQVAACRERGPRVVVVVSARGRTTDELLATAAALGAGPHDRDTDQLVATGEVASAATVALALRGQGVAAVSLTGAQAGITASGRAGSGIVSAIDPTALRRHLADDLVPVVAGFQGVNADGEAVTLGRGGSDTTAVALAAALGARCEIYSDVPGVCSADPRVVPAAAVLPRVDPAVMVEMTFAGARVLHSRAAEVAVMHDVELHVARTGQDSAATGTRIAEAAAPGSSGDPKAALEECGVVVAVAHDPDVARILVQVERGHFPTDPAALLLTALGKRAVPVDLVARSGPQEEELRIGFTVRRGDVDDVRAAVAELAASTGVGPAVSLRVDDEVGKLSLVGTGLLNRPAVTSRVLGLLADAEIPVSWVSTSQLRTSAIVPRALLPASVALLHDAFSLAADSPPPPPPSAVRASVPG